MSNPIEDPRSCDYVVLNGLRSPGIAEITNADNPRRWDERRGYGLSGARSVFRGMQLAYPKLTLTLLTAEAFEAWNTWRDAISPPPAGERPQALSIEHPFLADLGITAVNIKNVKQPVALDDGGWTVEIEMIEYRPPVPALAVPKGASDGRQLSANEQTILNLQQQLAARAAG